jgi:hypothetical protein
MVSIGKSLIFLGLGICLLGIAFVVFSRFKVPFLGRLPGDIIIKKENFTFYFPLATSLLISLILSVVLYFFSRSLRKY